IHLGDHEGLGLGFYEAIAAGTPVLTIDTPPNNEIIREGINGWLIQCDYAQLTDNDEGLVKKAVISVKDLKSKLVYLMQHYACVSDRESMRRSVMMDYLKRYPIHVYTEMIRRHIA